MKILLLSILLTVALHAETVLVTRNGKTWHREGGTCLTLRRNVPTKPIDSAKAKAIGLSPCKSCYKTTVDKPTKPDNWSR